MWTARDTLFQLENHIAQARGEVDRLDATLASATAEAARLRTERTQALAQLAQVRLDGALRAPVEQRLQATERRAREIIARRAERMAALADKRIAAAAAIEAARGERDAAQDAVEAAIDALDGRRAEVAGGVRASAAWTAAERAVEEARSVADEADKKARVAEEDLAVKRKPYDADPLFSYLWARGFGTSAYRASPFVKFMDRWVARVCGYDAARPNYFMLNEIPVRLRAHAAARLEAVAEAEAARGRVERSALEAAGIGPLEAALDAARARLAAAETALDQREADLAALDRERDGAGDDPAWREAIDLVASELAQTDIRRLEEQAFATPTVEDDQIVRRLRQIDAAIGKVDAEITETRAVAREAARRRGELERGRDQFRRQGYDHPMGTFGNEGLIGQVLTGILKGIATSGDLDRVLRDGYGRRQSRSDDRFGGGAPWGRGPWGGASGGMTGGSTGSWSGGSWGGGGGGSSRGSSGGGYKTTDSF